MGYQSVSSFFVLLSGALISMVVILEVDARGDLGKRLKVVLRVGLLESKIQNLIVEHLLVMASRCSVKNLKSKELENVEE